MEVKDDKEEGAGLGDHTFRISSADEIKQVALILFCGWALQKSRRIVLFWKNLTFALTTVHRRAATANRRNILGTEREHSKSTMVLQVLQPVRLHCKFGYSLFFSHIPQPSSDAHGTNPNRQHAHSVTRLSIDSFPM